MVLKTFKLKKLRIVEGTGEELLYHHIKMIDGLIINREDDQDRWVIEAYTQMDQFPIFERLQQEREEFMLEAIITKENNTPVVFIGNLIGLNKMEENMNVLFMGKIVDQRKSKIESLLETLIIEGYQGESLLKAFKKRIQ
ncbi:YwpF family protein [Virgibacillus sp. 179-BFC.A HS]|uniref:YwpF family protein n=1 Tax=Tigheibacillus jepli TaxID=3035914 RepID=A0ABU5CIJ1_9BACI|nr:YwpF family protein [Virgibacillus sp. 179-BFC.A HS]MDY0406040.1 YwpF family protein [Virgibacillus sp. 179-BFC.A HS]